MSDKKKKKNVKRPLRNLEARDLMKATGGAPPGAASIPEGALGFMPTPGHPVLGFVPTKPRHHHRPHHPVLGLVPSGPKKPILGFVPSGE